MSLIYTNQSQTQTAIWRKNIAANSFLLETMNTAPVQSLAVKTKDDNGGSGANLTNDESVVLHAHHAYVRATNKNPQTIISDLPLKLFNAFKD